MFGKISQFLGEVRVEMGKVTWPTRDELKSSTTIVLILSLALAGFIYIVDTFLASIMEFILI
ncbi:MAG: preprotein translocase subunit SecE [Gemmatimonadetes bacterium]|jgi:preprotein translocase subunit SecE|nr:preprotein translocase subunit SecE [Gemmatimonadota bacterium]